MWLVDLRFRLNAALLRSAQIPTRKMPILRLRVHSPRLDVVDLRVKTVPAMNQRPIFVDDPIARIGRTRAAPASVILQPAANVIRLLVIQSDFIKLADSDIVQEVPGL